MEDHLEFSADDNILAQIDWNDFFDGFPEDGTNSFDLEPPFAGGDSSDPDSISSWINELENALINDDEDKAFSSVLTDDCCNTFLADADPLLDSHGVDAVIDKVSPAPEVLLESHAKSSELHAVLDLDSNASDCGDDLNKSHKDKKVKVDDSGDEDADDPISRKRRRQLRNRDAAVRSRERKKTYVKDLEMKSKFLEGECRRLGRLLQCCCAENQALRFSLQMGGASSASLTKQESAVLLLESLLLGSLLWLVGTVCLFTLPQLPQSTLEPVPRVTMVEEGPGSARLNGGGNDDSRYSYSLLQSRRCRAARTRMKQSMLEAIWISELYLNVVNVRNGSVVLWG